MNTFTQPNGKPDTFVTINITPEQMGLIRTVLGAAIDDARYTERWTLLQSTLTATYDVEWDVIL